MSSGEAVRLDDVARTLRDDPEAHRRLVRALVRMVIDQESRERRRKRLRKMDR